VGVPQREYPEPPSLHLYLWSFLVRSDAFSLSSLKGMDFLAIPTLTGTLATLEPLTPEHAGELAEAVAEDDLYKVWFTRLPSPDRMSAEIEKRLTGHAAGQIVPWTIRDAHGRAVGMTTFLNIRPDHRRLEIGSTWIAPSAQGTGVNPQVKLLQLTYAFEALECIAVEFRTHWHNHRSRAAVAALGAKQDGVLRNHDLWRDGTMRDVVVFSIIESEWPTVRLSLTEKLRTRYPTEPK
jgi:N-acetyltransferase